MHWYVLRVAANKEMQVKEALERKVEQEALQEIIGRIEVPTEQIKRIRAGNLLPAIIIAPVIVAAAAWLGV